MIITRTAVESDIEQILVISQDSISPPWTHGFLLKELYRDDSFFIVAEHDLDNNIAGFSILQKFDDDGCLLQIAVEKSFRRAGIGDLLMESILSIAKNNKLKSVFLEVRKNNIAAICLYKKHGFKYIRTRKDYYTDPVEDALVMATT